MNGCHNREPFKRNVLVQHGWKQDSPNTRRAVMKVIPFQNSGSCQYTRSDLGRVDPGCTGCKWRTP